MIKYIFSTVFVLMLIYSTGICYAQDRYCRYEHENANHYGKVQGNEIYELDKAPWNGGEETGKTINIEKVRLLYPSEPNVIIGLGKSYKQSWDGKAPPKTVRWFVKPPTSAGNPNDGVILPAMLDAVKVEVELVIVIGKKVKNATPEEANKAIFGYTIGNDIVGYTESYLKKSDDTLESAGTLLGSGLKIGDGFQPFGPFIFTGIEWQNRKKTLTVNSPGGKIKASYSENTSDILYTPEKIVSDLSKVLTLNPGDIISSGTAKSFLAEIGDLVTIEIEGIGVLKSTIIKK